MKFGIATVVMGVMTWAATGPGLATVPVGQEFPVLHEVTPAVTAIDADGNILESAMPEPPYVWEYKYARELIAFARADDGVTATYREIEGTPWAVLKCESANTSGAVYFKALKVTSGDIALPVQNATANGNALTIANADKLNITAKPAQIQIRIEGPATITVSQ